ncbi:ABC transporter ATP-binding protein [Dongia soli]|uniref:ABC transporter ATP-binding protein n=1 Tax=Dongia soli TaxID=600628 RepID=A0ABU5EJP6_9PROT|nr:ABC transporter ATP-binding protein [Dongia soli]MDY0885483.1 ABC transporter ATP-binding protein [Dongia soli]
MQAAAASAPLLHVRTVWKKFGDRVTAAGVDLQVGNGEFFTMLGPSGSGKSTVLRMISGLEQPDGGRILINGEDVTDLPPWRRGLGMVFQQYANFPHMTVAQNIGYGLRRSNLDRAALRERVSELLDLVSLPGFEDKPVTKLSGGEQQRVAIARALAPRPRLLLLDEPLSALDEKIRREMQVQLKDIQRATGTAFVYVTHDQEEALTMSDRVAVLNWGYLVQVDAPQALFRQPRTKFVAQFFRGSNVVEGRFIGSGTQTVFDCAAFRLDCGAVANPANPPAVAIRNEDIRINAHSVGNVAEGETAFDAVLERVVYRGIYTDFQFKLADGQIIVASATTNQDLASGARVRLAVKTDRIIPLHAEPS